LRHTLQIIEGGTAALALKPIQKAQTPPLTIG
jgi:hypothetical protein